MRSRSPGVRLDPSQRILIIAGAPRAGTTSLSRYLSAREDVCFSSVKEPHFFSRYDLRDLPDEELARFVEREYLQRFFPHCGAGQMLCESSTTYLYSYSHMPVILRLWPEARFIVIVRDPFEMLPSLHQRLTFQADETELDFERAWDLQGERAQGRKIPSSCVDSRWLRYEEAGRLGKYAAAFGEAVGRERLLVLTFDELRDDPAAVYLRMLGFAGLPDDGRREFGAHNPAKGFRLFWLQRLIKRPPVITRRLLGGRQFRERLQAIEADGDGFRKRPDPILARHFDSLRKALRRWNRAPPRKQPLSLRLQAEIRDRLAGDVDRLSRLIGRDLSHWLGRGVDRRPPINRPAPWA